MENKYRLSSDFNYLILFRKSKNDLSNIEKQIDEITLTYQNINKLKGKEAAIKEEITNLHKTHEIEKIDLMIKQCIIKLNNLQEIKNRIT